MSIVTTIGSKLRSFAAFFRAEFFDEDEIEGHREFINEAAGVTTWIEQRKEQRAEAIARAERIASLTAAITKAKRQKKKHSHLQAEIDSLKSIRPRFKKCLDGRIIDVRTGETV